MIREHTIGNKCWHLGALSKNNDDVTDWSAGLPNLPNQNAKQGSVSSMKHLKAGKIGKG